LKCFQSADEFVSRRKQKKKKEKKEKRNEKVTQTFKEMQKENSIWQIFKRTFVGQKLLEALLLHVDERSDRNVLSAQHILRRTWSALYILRRKMDMIVAVNSFKH
jgi:hypothetical protein